MKAFHRTRSMRSRYKMMRSGELIRIGPCCRFWKQTSEHCPETRVEMAKQHQKAKSQEIEKKTEEPKPRKLFAVCGRPYNLNEPKLTFTIDECHDRFVLDLHIYKYLCYRRTKLLPDLKSEIFFPSCAQIYGNIVAGCGRAAKLRTRHR